jgi:hypothetical protein
MNGSFIYHMLRRKTVVGKHMENTYFQNSVLCYSVLLTDFDVHLSQIKFMIINLITLHLSKCTHTETVSLNIIRYILKRVRSTSLYLDNLYIFVSPGFCIMNHSCAS